MEDIYAAIVGEPTSDKEKLLMLAQKLRKQQLLGQLGQVTGDRVLSPMGKQMVLTTDAQAEDIGRRGETARYRQYQEKQSADSLAQRQAEQEWRKQHDTQTLGLQRAQLAQAAEIARLNREALLERARIAAEAKKEASSTGMKLQSKAMQDAVRNDRVAATALRLKNEMPKSAVRENIDVLGGILSKVDPGIGQRFINSYYSDTDNKWRADADLLDQDLSNLAAGLAVTGFELANKQKWSPRAPGLTYEQAQARWDNIHQKFSEASAYAKGKYEEAGGTTFDVDAEIARLEEEIALMGGSPDG